MVKQNRRLEWNETIAGIRSEHSRLTALKEELNRAGL